MDPKPKIEPSSEPNRPIQGDAPQSTSSQGMASTSEIGDGNASASSLKEEAQRAGANISEVAGSVASDLKDVAREKLNAAVSEAGVQSNDMKNHVAGEVGSVAEALRRAVSDLRSGSPQERTLGLIANGLADASDAMRNRDLGEMVSDLQDIARRKPMLFLGAAAMLGFAAARFGKASETTPTQSGSRPGPV